MKIDKILLGAARGARIERKHFKDAEWMPWENAQRLPLPNAESDYIYRVHPDDVHLCELQSLYEITGDIKDINTLLLSVST